MKRQDSRARQTSTRRQKAQSHHAGKKADRADAPIPPTSHTFPTTIQIVLDETATLSMVVQELLARGVEAFMRAVKHQLALLAAPPERGLPPPKGPADEDGHNEQTLQAVPRRPRRRR